MISNKKSKDKKINENIHAILKKKQDIISNETEKNIQKIIKDEEILLQEIIQRIIVEEMEAGIIDGYIFSVLIETNNPAIQKKLLDVFPNGVFKLKPSLKLNYQTLQNLLIKKKFQEADKLTHQHLCELIKLEIKHERMWLYFTDIQFLPKEDLMTIDSLWKIYSKGKFGFSTQKKIWINNEYKWNKLWTKIGWIENQKNKRYPQEFIWTLEAPEGHLPLLNQIRGNQALASLFDKIL